MDNLDVKEIINNLIPDKEKQRIYLEIFCEVIKYADSYGSEKWGISAKRDGIKLKVGSLTTTSIQKNAICFALNKELINKTTAQKIQQLV